MATGDFEYTINERLAEYALDTIFYFRDGFITETIDLPATWYDFGSRQASSKPSNEPYVSFRFVSGLTLNAGIKSAQLVAKHENIALEFSIFTPVDQSKKTSNTIEDELDRLFLNWSSTGNEYYVIPDTQNPKRSLPIPASGNDISSIKQIQYRFIYRYG